MQEFKYAAKACLREFLASGDDGEVMCCLQELGHPEHHHVFVKQVSFSTALARSNAADRHPGNRHIAQAVQLAIEGKDGDREAIAALLSMLTPSPITHEQLSLGFQELLCAAEVTRIASRATSERKRSI